MSSYEKLDDITYDIDEYYVYYGIPLWLLYIRSVYSIYNHCMHHDSHFPMLTAINGVLDILLYMLGNFFYRWPHEIRYPQRIYRLFNENSHFVGFLYFLLTAFHYALFISTFFMAFFVFSTVLFRRHWHKWWHGNLHRYVAKIFILPIILFLDVLISAGYFRYIAEKEEFFLMLSSRLPPIVTRARGVVILSLLMAGTVIFLVITAVGILITVVFQKRRFVNHEISNFGVVVVFAACRFLFLHYQILTIELRIAGQKENLFILGRSFPVWNDVICLAPALLNIIISKPIRRLTFPFLYWRRHKVDKIDKEDVVKPKDQDDEDVDDEEGEEKREEKDEEKGDGKREDEDEKEGEDKKTDVDDKDSNKEHKGAVKLGDIKDDKDHEHRRHEENCKENMRVHFENEETEETPDQKGAASRSADHQDNDIDKEDANIVVSPRTPDERPNTSTIRRPSQEEAGPSFFVQDKQQPSDSTNSTEHQQDHIHHSDGENKQQNDSLKV